MTLDDTVAIVTGGESGIGAARARASGEAGAGIVTPCLNGGLSQPTTTLALDHAPEETAGRGVEPMPPPTQRAATDIAFAASTVMGGDLMGLYLSIEDRNLCRALIRRYA